MQIKVISLAGSSARRNSIQSQFDRLELDFDFFDAITPDQSACHIAAYDEEQFILNCGRPATATEIACYASHLALWRECAAERVPYLILEDDARLQDGFCDAFEITAREIDRFQFLRLSIPEISGSAHIRRVGPFDIRFCRRVPLLALGYAVGPAAARQLLLRGDTVEEPVDKYLQRFWRHRQPVFALTPAVVDLTEHAEQSDIGIRQRPHQTTSIRLRRALRKAGNSIARTVYGARLLRQTASQPNAPPVKTA